uniref:Uncharacterized protein n=1 Tax=Nelumbo nucifera TaxID=4432 RepID=A0A822ZI75_NELNU|nr:TPA_asm: hypothetical protein HUJ06_002807 [Nelumbo nucifera]
MGASSPTGGAELRVRMPGVVVVRDYNRIVRTVDEPESDGSFHGRSDTNNGSDLRVSVIPGLRRVNTCRKRAGSQPSEQSQGVSGGSGVGSVYDGSIGHCIHLGDEEQVGPYVYLGRGDPTVDVRRSAHPGTLRNWQLSTNSWLWGAEGHCTANHGC